MTDKQIIIDGVDVKDCKRRIGKDNFCRYYKRPCTENNYNCIWKKYLRKEQECEELKKIIDEAKNSKLDLKSFLVGEAVQNEYEQQLNQLKAENEELKKRIAGYKCPMEKNADYCGYLEESGLIYVENEFLKQTLAEIKEICNNNDELKGDFNLVDCDKYKLGKHNLANKILEKISEVENG